MSTSADDRFIREGRIGPALVEYYNLEFNQSHPVRRCSFSVFGDGRGVAIAVRMPRGQITIFKVRELPRVLRGELTAEERLFFQRFGRL